MEVDAIICACFLHAPFPQSLVKLAERKEGLCQDLLLGCSDLAEQAAGLAMFQWFCQIVVK